MITRYSSTEYEAAKISLPEHSLWIDGTDYMVRTGDDIPPTPEIVASCTSWQLRRYLSAMGLRATVESYVATQDQTVKDGWEYHPTFESNNPFVVAAAAALNLDPLAVITAASLILDEPVV